MLPVETQAINSSDSSAAGTVRVRSWKEESWLVGSHVSWWNAEKKLMVPTICMLEWSSCCQPYLFCHMCSCSLFSCKQQLQFCCRKVTMIICYRFGKLLMHPCFPHGDCLLHPFHLDVMWPGSPLYLEQCLVFCLHNHVISVLPWTTRSLLC